jgi:hypothetical protein
MQQWLALLTSPYPFSQVKVTPAGWSKMGTMAPCMDCVFMQKNGTYSPNPCYGGVPKPSNTYWKGLSIPLQQ